MIGYPYTPEPLSGDRSKQLAEKYITKVVSPDEKETVKMPEIFTEEWENEKIK